MPERLEIPDGKLIQINAIEILLNCENGKAINIKRILLEKNYQEEKNEV